jgi:hypothetical protein
VVKFTSPTTMCNSNIFDNGTNIGVFTNAPLNFWHFTKSSSTGVWDTYWENTGTLDGVKQVYNTNTANGSRVLMGVTNYSLSAFAASAVIGLSLNNTSVGTGGIGVTGAANNESGYAVYGSLAFTGPYTGWGGYFNADVYCGGTYITSDRRLKREIKPIVSAMSIINQLEPVSYYYDTDKYPGIGLDENRMSFGFIAQDLEKVLPELVKDKNLILNSNKQKTTGTQEPLQTEQFKLVNYTLLIPILTEGLKEQQQVIDSQKKQIDEINTKLQEMQKLIEALQSKLGQ